MTQAVELRDPIVIAAFEGWNDAANASTDALRFLERHFNASKVHELEAQEYSDFQATRPHVELANGVVQSIRWISTTISTAVVTNATRDLILVLGIEPNLKWQQFCDEILSIASIHGATTVVTLGALLGDAPHTRPFPVTGTASDPATVERLGLQRSQYVGPTGIVGVLADAARRAQFDAISLWVPVPHYVATPPNPKATLTLLDRLSALFDIPLELKNLSIAAHGWQTRVDAMVETDGDLTAYVHQLEARFDSDETLDVAGLDPHDLVIGATPDFESLFDDVDYYSDEDEDDEDEDDEAPGPETPSLNIDDLPSGESLAEDFERYLREHRRDDD